MAKRGETHVEEAKQTKKPWSREARGEGTVFQKGIPVRSQCTSPTPRGTVVEDDNQQAPEGKRARAPDKEKKTLFSRQPQKAGEKKNIGQRGKGVKQIQRSIKATTKVWGTKKLAVDPYAG